MNLNVIEASNISLMELTRNGCTLYAIYAGHYQSVTPTKKDGDQDALFVSPLIKPKDGKCVSFWYKMPKGGFLLAYAATDDTKNSGYKLDNRIYTGAGDSGGTGTGDSAVWQFAQAPLPYTHNFYVSLT